MISSFTLTVSQVNFYIKSLIDSDVKLQNINIVGEISNFTNHYKTGHYYFTLKDNESSIKSVMFKKSVDKLRFVPENGMSVIVQGRLSVFERDGQYQIYVDNIEPHGLGSIAKAIEQIKDKLSKEGLFEQSRKKPIPKFPQRIGIVTSATGAAFHDIISILNRRFPVAEIIFAPVNVEGKNATAQVIDAINNFQKITDIDVLIIGRGGGSLEDLWAFQDESLARSVSNCTIPIISAVGHETDFTIIDFVADLRAPTPSAAAELAAPNIDDLRKTIRIFAHSLNNSINSIMSNKQATIDKLVENKVLSNPTAIFNIRIDCIMALHNRLIASYNLLIDKNINFIENYATKLDALSPLKILSRGYSYSVNSSNAIIKRSSQVQKDEIITVNLSEGSLKCIVKDIK